MGLLDLDKTLQNATKCGTWHDIKGPCIYDVTQNVQVSGPTLPLSVIRTGLQY